MNKPVTRSSRLAFVLALLLPAAAMAAPFTNGGFESPGIPPGTQASIGPGVNEPTGWKAGGTATSSNFALFYQNSLYFPGGNSIGFGGNGTTGASISQTFDTLAGQNYTVAYQATQQQGTSLQTLAVEAFNGTVPLTGTLLGLVNFTVPAYGAGETFHLFTGTPLTFTALSGSTTLTFLDTTLAQNSGPSNFSIDNVTVNGSGVTTPVPEPETYALMLAGLGILSTVARRRKAKSI